MILIDKNAHINKCHLCNSKLFPYSVLQLNGMPKAAQYYPNENEFKDDKGIILNIFQCSDCGLVQLNINPVDYFKEVITSTSFSENNSYENPDLIFLYSPEQDLKRYVRTRVSSEYLIL